MRLTLLLLLLTTSCFPGPLPQTDAADSDVATDTTVTTDTQVATEASTTEVVDVDADVAVEVDAAPECDDADDCNSLDSPCHEGHCNAGRCEAQALTGSACDDGDKCTTGDTCDAGVCGGEAKTCEAPTNPCLEARCSASNGACEEVARDDGTPCDDASACTSNDHCDDGICKGSTVDCPVFGACMESNACDPASGCMPVPKPLDSVCEEGGKSGFCRGLNCGSKLLALARTHTCVVLPNSRLKCWGRGGGGPLGYGDQETIGDDESPSEVGDSLAGAWVTGVATSESVTCALFGDGGLSCFGSSPYGELGYGPSLGNYGQSEVPSRRVPLDSAVRKVVSGNSYFCALLDTGRVQCWGSGRFGVLGYGDTYDVSDPSAAGLVDVGWNASDLFAGPNSSCAIGPFGQVRCWGYNSGGQLGYGTSDALSETQVPSTRGDIDVGMQVRELAIGTSTTCARNADGLVKCWGSAVLGYSGPFEPIGDDETPADVGYLSFPGKVSQLSANLSVTCALIESGDVMCWGNSTFGTLGLGSTNFASVPARVPLPEASVGVFAGGWHVCAVSVTGKVRCWGSNEGAELGYPAQALGDHLGDEDDEALTIPVEID